MSRVITHRYKKPYLYLLMSKLELPYFVPDDRYSIEQYLAIEKVTGKRYEYHDGQLISVESMAGGSYNHAVLAGNFIREAGNAIIASEKSDTRLKGCDATTSDLRIAVDGGKRYLYADAVIVCDEPLYDEMIPSAIVNPIIVIEILSPSSEFYDRGLKFEYYKALESVREYIIIEQDHQRVEIRHRDDSNSAWRYTIATMEDESVSLASLGIEVSMQGLYRNWKAPESL